MAENKKSFVLYTDLIHTVSKLPNEKAGELFKIILEYVNDKDPKIEDLLLQISFEPIKQQLKRDLINWSQIREYKAIAGKKGGFKSGEVRKQKKANEAGALKSKQKQANEAVTVNVTVTDNVTDIKKEYKEIIDKWLNYKKNRGEKYKDMNSIFLMYKKLFDYSKGNEVLALTIIEDAMSNNYAGFFKPRFDSSQQPQPQMKKVQTPDYSKFD